MSTEGSLDEMVSSCGIPAGLEVMVPNPFQRPWTPLAGYICLYESFFTSGQLWFLLPKLLVSYCVQRSITFSQLTIGSIQNMVGILVLAAECGLPVCCRSFEETSSIKKVPKKIGRFYVNMKKNVQHYNWPP